MADIRINALATTATASASDDYLAIDGSANGTRKLSAYSPTFGGNVTVSGNGTVSNILTAGGGFWSTGYTSLPADAVARVVTGVSGGAGYLQSATGNTQNTLSIDGSTVTIRASGYTTAATFTNTTTSLGGNLTVSGTGTSIFGGNITLGASSSTWSAGQFALDLSSTGAINSDTGNNVVVSSNAYYNAAWKYKNSNYAGLSIILSSGDFGWFTAPSGTANASISLTQAMTLKNGGNLLLGTTTDNGAKFQVEGYATFNRNGADGYLSVSRTSGATGTFGAGSSNAYLGTASNHPLVLYTNNITALTLDSSQRVVVANATNNGSKFTMPNNTAIAWNNAANSGDGGSLYFDNTNALQLRTGSGASLALTLDSSQRTILSGALRLNNAYTASVIVPTGYVTIQDSTGTTYKVAVSL